MTFQQHIDALQSALAQTRTDFGGPAICSVMAEDLRVALHLIGQAALVPSAGSADSVRVVAWRARDGHGLPQTTWIDGDPGPQMESAWVGGDIECAYAGPVAAQAPIPEGQQPYPPTPAPDVQSSGEAEDSYSRAAVERAMRAAHDRGYSVGWDHGHAAQAPAAAMPDEIEGLRAHVALLKSALAQSERENDELRALAAAGDAQPAVWVAADTLNSPHPTCISSLAYMSQIDQNRGREYVPLYAAPVAAQTADDARDADMFWNADDPEQFSATDLQGAVEYIMDDYRPSDLPMELDLLCARSMPNVQVRVTGYNEADGWQYEVVDAAIAAQVQQQGEA